MHEFSDDCWLFLWIGLSQGKYGRYRPFYMSMIYNISRLTDQQLELLVSNPNLITGFLYDEPTEVSQGSDEGILSKILEWFQRKSEVRSVPPTKPIETVDLDKAWHTLHFLFTGTSWEGEFPSSFLLSGGVTIGDVDVGYGPARGYNSAEVVKIAEFLRSVNKDSLRDRCDPKTLNENQIYPQSPSIEPMSDDDWSYFEGALNTLTEIVERAKNQHSALLVYIN